jgi:hypothetical protein
MTNFQARQSFLGQESREILRNGHVGIVGLGGGGSHVAQQLAHIGVENFVLCDPDSYEDKNHNRTVGGTTADVDAKTAKVRIAQRLIGDINPKASVSAVKHRWQNALPFLRGCHAIFGCVDSYTERDQLERLSRRFLIPYIDIGMDVSKVESGHVVHGQVVLSLPGSLCMHCFNFLRPDLLELEAREYGQAGGRPQVIWPNGILASTAVGLFVQLILPWHGDVRLGSAVYDYDGNRHTMILSPRVSALSSVVCSHFCGLEGEGDPFWNAGDVVTPTVQAGVKILHPDASATSSI